MNPASKIPHVHYVRDADHPNGWRVIQRFPGLKDREGNVIDCSVGYILKDAAGWRVIDDSTYYRTRDEAVLGGLRRHLQGLDR